MSFSHAFIKQYNKNAKNQVKIFLKVNVAFLKYVYSQSNDSATFKSFLKEQILKIQMSQRVDVVTNLIAARNKFISNYHQSLNDDNHISITNSTTTTDTNNASSHAKKKKTTLVVHLGDYLALVNAIASINDAQIVIENAANSKHIGGIAAYGAGSAEEMLARKSNLWMELVLTAVSGDRQKQALILIFDTVLQIMEHGEDKFFNSKHYQDYLNKAIDIVYKDNQDYFLNNESDDPEKRYHVNQVFYIHDLDASFAEIINDASSNNFNQSLILTQVASVAGVDQRIIGGTTNTLNALAYRVGQADGKYQAITEQLIKDTIDVALQQERKYPGKPVFLIMLPVGCGAYKGNANDYANCLTTVLKENAALKNSNITLFIASFPDNYKQIYGALSTLKEDYNILPNASNYISNVGLNLLPNTLTGEKNTSLSLCNVDLTDNNALNLDVVMVSTNPYLAPQGFLHSKKSLINKLCDSSTEFKQACINHPPIAPGQIADMGEHVFYENHSTNEHLNPLRIILTTTHQIKIGPTPAEIKDIMSSYINGLLYANNLATQSKKKINAALTFFGTGSHGWKEDQMLILAVKLTQNLLKHDNLPNIQSIYFVSNNIKSLKLTASFNKCLTDDTHFTTLLPRDAFDKLVRSITQSSTQNLAIKTMLEPSHNHKTKQNVCMYLTVFDQQHNKLCAVFGNKDVSKKKSRQFKNFFTGEYNYLKVPGGRVDNNSLSIVETGLKELQEECGIDLSQLSKTYPDAKICYVGAYALDNNSSYLHCYWLDIGSVKNIQEFKKNIKLKASDDVDHLDVVVCDQALLPNRKLSLADMDNAKEIHELNQQMLKTILTKNSSFMFYSLQEIESLGLKMTFENDDSHSLTL